MKPNRFYREPDPIGIGSIVIRFTIDGNGIEVGQIFSVDESLSDQARWMVFANGRPQRWHSATITRKLKDYEEAAFVRGAAAAVEAMVAPCPTHLKVEFKAAARAVLEAISNGSISP